MLYYTLAIFSMISMKFILAAVSKKSFKASVSNYNHFYHYSPFFYKHWNISKIWKISGNHWKIEKWEHFQQGTEQLAFCTYGRFTNTQYKHIHAFNHAFLYVLRIISITNAFIDRLISANYFYHFILITSLIYCKWLLSLFSFLRRYFFLVFWSPVPVPIVSSIFDHMNEHSTNTTKRNRTFLPPRTLVKSIFYPKQQRYQVAVSVPARKTRCPPGRAANSIRTVNRRRNSVRG